VETLRKAVLYFAGAESHPGSLAPPKNGYARDDSRSEGMWDSRQSYPERL